MVRKDIESTFSRCVSMYYRNGKVLERPLLPLFEPIKRKMYGISWYQAISAYRHIGISQADIRNISTTRYLDWRNAQPVEEPTRIRAYVGISTSKDARDKRALCREKRSVTVVPRASICRYLFNFSIGKHRQAANTFLAIWLCRLCRVKEPQYRHDRLSSSSLLSQTMPFHCWVEL